MVERCTPGVVPGRSYPEPLPAELVPWYCYLRDGGHSIAVVVPEGEGAPEDPTDYLVPVPVRTVLRTEWHVDGGYVYCRVPYDPQLGVLTEQELRTTLDEQTAGEREQIRRWLRSELRDALRDGDSPARTMAIPGAGGPSPDIEWDGDRGQWAAFFPDPVQDDVIEVTANDLAQETA